MKKFNHLKKLIDENESFLLIGHVKPDGDTVGALRAFRNYLVEHQKNVTVALLDPIPEMFSYLDSKDFISKDFLFGNFDMVVLLDCGDLNRTGYAKRIEAAKKKKIPIINIDHHPKNDIWKMTKHNFADPNASSTCEILFNYFKEMGIQVDSNMATALLSGIYNDTGGFKHTNTSNEVLRIASKLLSLGAKFKKVSQSVSQSKSVEMLKLWGIALNNIIERHDLGLVVSVLTLKEIKSTGASEEEVFGLVNLLATAHEARASMLIYETEDGKIRGSLRTEDNNIDVSRFASLFGGGGHKKASGFVIEGRIEKVKNNIRIV